jgi:hypothetical protein
MTMYKYLIFFISLHVFASDNYALTDDRAVYLGPSFKIWCSLSKTGLGNVGGKIKTKQGNLILFPQVEGTGHYPTVVVKDMGNSEQAREISNQLKSFCVEDIKDLPDYFNKNIKTWMTEKVALISIRTFDEVLWEFYADRFKSDTKNNACEIRKSYRIKKSWVVSYSELNKSCL